jgi:hypothetical protein
MSKWKFVLTNEKTGESQVLEAEFKADENIRDAEQGGYCGIWPSDASHGEALERLGYTLWWCYHPDSLPITLENQQCVTGNMS